MSTAINAIATEKADQTKVEMMARIELLAGEIDANDEENREMDREITSLYKKISALENKGLLKPLSFRQKI